MQTWKTSAPKARNMKARGKREAKLSASPLVIQQTKGRGLKGRNTRAEFRPFRLMRFFY